MIVGLIGTTITPWMQFYLQAAVVEQGVDTRHYGLCRLDVIVGCIVTDVIAFFIVVACGATIYHTDHPEITDVAQAAVALVPVAGKFAGLAIRGRSGQRIASVRRHSAARHFL